MIVSIRGNEGRGVYRGRGRGTRGGRGGGVSRSYHIGHPNNKHTNKKWVRESPNNDDENGLKEGSTSSAGYPIKSNVSISKKSIEGDNSKSTASSYKWKRQSPEVSTNAQYISEEHSTNTIAYEKTTIKVDSTPHTSKTNDMKQSASVSTQSKSSTHVSSVNKSNSWKRQSSSINTD